MPDNQLCNNGYILLSVLDRLILLTLLTEESEFGIIIDPFSTKAGMSDGQWTRFADFGHQLKPMYISHVYIYIYS